MNKKTIIIGAIYTIFVWNFSKIYYEAKAEIQKNNKKPTLSEEDKEKLSHFSYPGFKDIKITERLYDGMKEYARKYGAVSIGDMYTLVGKKASYDAYSYGWKDTSSFSIELNDRGFYFVNTGLPTYID